MGVKILNRKIIKISLLFLVIGTIFICKYKYDKDEKYKAIERNIETDAMEIGFNNVYADLQYIERIGSISERTKYKYYGVTDYFCRGITTNGKEIYITTSSDMYRDLTSDDKDDEYWRILFAPPSNATFDTPVRVWGIIRDFSDIADNTEEIDMPSVEYVLAYAHTK